MFGLTWFRTRSGRRVFFHWQCHWHTIKTCPENWKNIVNDKFRHLQWSVTSSHCHRQCRWHGRIPSETSQSIKRQIEIKFNLLYQIEFQFDEGRQSTTILRHAEHGKAPYSLACETQLVCNWEGGGSTIDKNDPDLGGNGDPETKGV